MKELRKSEISSQGLNPLKRVNSILTKSKLGQIISSELVSIPSTGQFNSYAAELVSLAESMKGLNPLKRVNSILTNNL